MSAVEIAGGLEAFVRKLNDAVALANEAHALEGQIGAARQTLAALKADADKAREAGESEKAMLAAELEALKADAKKRKDKAAQAERDVQVLMNDAAARASALIEDAKAAAQGEADKIRASIAAMAQKEAEAEARAAEADARADAAQKAAANAEAEFAKTQKRIKQALGL